MLSLPVTWNICLSNFHLFSWLRRCIDAITNTEVFFFTLWTKSMAGQNLVSAAMAKHHPDLIMCRKQPGIAIGRLCEKCDGKCVICDSYVRPCTLVRICDECNYGSFQGRCVICGGVGISDAYYCKECTQQEKDRDGCPKIVNLGSAKTDLFYERKKYGFKKRWSLVTWAIHL